MDDNTYECPNCSATIYPEMTRCPQCGQNMYPEDEEAYPTGANLEGAGWTNVAGGVVIGWLISAGVALIIHFVVARIVTPTTLGMTGRIVLFLAGGVGSFTGAYVGAAIARQRGVILGAIVGILAVPASVLLATYWVRITPEVLLSAWGLAAIGLVILGGIAGGWLSHRRLLDSGGQEGVQVRGWEDLLYQELLRKVRFNGAAADRLIDYERKREPRASRLRLIQNAIEHWEQDNR